MIWMRSQRRGMMSKLVLQKEIYKKEAIENTIHAFREIVNIILVEENKNEFVLNFTECVADPQRTMDEFGNYVLAETIKKVGGLYD